MLKHDTDGTGGETEQRSFYGYNPHIDVETLTTKTGETRATYGYTAYGNNDTDAFTGIDTPQPDHPGVAEPYNPYRFNHKRFDAASGSYDMGFRTYDPGTSRFTERDLYLGARANMGLTVDGFTGNRYAFTAGNPISRIELDGHCFMDTNGVCDSPKNSGSTNDVDSYTLDNGTTVTQTPDGQAYINGYELPSGGPAPVALARAIDEFTPLIRDVQAMGSGPLSRGETAVAIAAFCDAEGKQDLCGDEWSFKVHAGHVAEVLPEALIASGGGTSATSGAVAAVVLASSKVLRRSLVRAGWTPNRGSRRTTSLPADTRLRNRPVRSLTSLECVSIRPTTVYFFLDIRALRIRPESQYTHAQTTTTVGSIVCSRDHPAERRCLLSWVTYVTSC